MTRPQIVRADTLDLQPNDAPSAKDHSRQPTSPQSIGVGPPAPHQALSMMKANLDGMDAGQHNPSGSSSPLATPPEAKPRQRSLSPGTATRNSRLSQSPRTSQDMSNKELQLLQHERAENHDISEEEDPNGEYTLDGDDDDDSEIDDDLLDKISSSPSIEDEDIDFEFVYALHTFVATVEGQANAQKGDTMVLLDDSNSYWWLVRVVKDSSIGYLPAEHIETPTERLARLNKHRNIDLSQSMLTDSQEKPPKSTIQKMVRRRGGRQVTFTESTYYDAPVQDWSDEESDDEEFGMQQGQTQTVHERQAQLDREKAAAAEAAAAQSAQGSTRPSTATTATNSIREINEPASNAEPIITTSEIVEDAPRPSTDSQEIDPATGLRRHRNTDSFYKNEAETRKINLTPSLLRDDSVRSTTTVAVAPPPSEARTSTDMSEKRTSFEKPRDDKKPDKKKGMLSGLFKRRERKSKSQSEDDDPDWLRNEIASQQGGSASPSTSIESGQDPTSPTSGKAPVGRTPSKLQKQPPATRARSASNNTVQTAPIVTDNQAIQSQVQTPPQQHQPSLSPVTPISPFTTSSLLQSNGVDARNPVVDKEAERAVSAPERPSGLAIATGPGMQQGSQVSLTQKKATNFFAPTRAAPKPEQTKPATTRMPIDDDSFEDSVETQQENPYLSDLRSADNVRDSKDSHNESLVSVPVSPIVHASLQQQDEGPPSPITPPELQADQSNWQQPNNTRMAHEALQQSYINETHSYPPQHAPPSVPQSQTSHPTQLPNGSPESTRSLTMSSLTNSPHSPEVTQEIQHPSSHEQEENWNTASLRAYLDDSNEELNTMLTLVYDTSGMPEPGPDHPVVKQFGNEKSRLDNMDKKLDDLLKGLIGRRAGQVI